jgi:hypothetical protein
MKYSKLIVVVVGFAVWAMMPRGSAYAQCSTGPGVYENCSAQPFTTVGPNSSSEQQVACNAGDTAIGGGMEVTSPALPLPPSTIVTTPESNLSNTDPTVWQVVVQNTNLDLSCVLKPKEAKCSIQFQVCVSCYTTCLQQTGTGGSASSGL